MTAKNQIYFWIGTFAAFLAFVYIFKSVLLPFVLMIRTSRLGLTDTLALSHRYLETTVATPWLGAGQQ